MELGWRAYLIYSRKSPRDLVYILAKAYLQAPGAGQSVIGISRNRKPRHAKYARKRPISDGRRTRSEDEEGRFLESGAGLRQDNTALRVRYKSWRDRVLTVSLLHTPRPDTT